MTRRCGESSKQDVIELLKREREPLDALARALLDRETLDQAEAYEVAGVDVPKVDVDQEAKAMVGPSTRVTAGG